MGLGKDTGSTRINRYEQQASAISFDSLIAVAQALDVPPAYLLADSPEMADAILALSGSPTLARLVQVLRATPELADAALRLAELPNEERDKALAALRALPR